jgi:hypothetical protein
MMYPKSQNRSKKQCKRIAVLFFFFGGLYAEPIAAQGIASLKDSAQFIALQDSFCACVNRHAGENSKDWGDAIALALLTKLDVNSVPYRNSELLMRKTNRHASMRRMDHVLDSIIISQGFIKCIPLWSVILKDKAGFYKRIEEIKNHPPLLQYQLPHLRECTGQSLLNYLKNGLSDSIAVLFDRRATFDSAAIALKKCADEIGGQIVTMEIKFEKRGKDSCGVAKMKLLKNGIIPLGGFRIIYQRGDTYAKIERLDMLLRDSFKTDELIQAPAPK